MDKVPTLGEASTYIMPFNLAEGREDELMRNCSQNFSIVSNSLLQTSLKKAEW